jgi:hypothetical protein
MLNYFLHGRLIRNHNMSAGYDYEAEKLRKRKETRIRKNKRNSRGRSQTQGAALGAISNILGG